MKPKEDQVRTVIEDLLAHDREVGIQVCAYLDGKSVIDVAMGKTARKNGRAVTHDTLFSVYSVAKGVTATCAHVLADRGLLDFDAPIADLWPEFGQNGKQAITLRHVLTHRAGIPQMPADVTPQRMMDWDWMVGAIAGLEPIQRLGEDNAYMAMSFGWVIGEVIRRADPAHRTVDVFLQQEICQPLGITDCYLRLPDSALPRYAEHSYVPDPLPPPDSLTARAIPVSVRLVPEVFSRPDVLQSLAPAVNGIANASSLARFFAMLAGEGELDGVRILSQKSVRGLLNPRTAGEEMEPVLGRPWRLSTGGFFLASSHKPAPGTSAGMVFAMGMGGSIAWADLETGLAAAITHNHMFNARSADEDPLLPVANAIRLGLGIDT